LFDYPHQASSLAVSLDERASASKVQTQIETLIGKDYKVQTRYQQKESFYRIMTYEKWGIYFIILLVLVVASFSLVGSLAMLIIEKRKDTQTLMTLGADSRLVRQIFAQEGLLISLGGGIVGLVLGLLLSLAQQYFGILKLSGQTFLIDAYPVEVRLLDLLWVIISFIVVGGLISTLTVKAMIPKQEQEIGKV